MPMYCHNPQPYPLVSREIAAFPQKKPANMLRNTRLVAARGTVAEPPATALDDGVLGDGGDVDGDGVELESERVSQQNHLPQPSRTEKVRQRGRGMGDKNVRQGA